MEEDERTENYSRGHCCIFSFFGYCYFVSDLWKWNWHRSNFNTGNRNVSKADRSRNYCSSNYGHSGSQWFYDADDFGIL